MKRRRWEQSLEALEERVEKKVAREEEDGEVELEELIVAMVRPRRARATREPEEMAGDEFSCPACHLIRPRSCMADEERMMCTDCAREALQPPQPVVRDHSAVQAPCPA